MSAENKVYIIQDGNFTDIGFDEFRHKCPKGSDPEKLHAEIKQKMKGEGGKWQVEFLNGEIRCSRERYKPISFPYQVKLDTPPPVDPETKGKDGFKAKNDLYKIQLKVDKSKDPDSGSPVFYLFEPQGGVDKADDWEQGLIDTFSEKVTLDQVTEVLGAFFSVSPRDLLASLAKLDLGTVMIDLALEKVTSRYQIIKFHQASQPSFRKDKYKDTNELLTKTNNTLKEENQALKKRIEEMETSLAELEDLRKLKSDHDSFMGELGLKHMHDDPQVRQVILERQKGELIPSVCDMAAKNVMRSIAPVTSGGSNVSELSDRVKSLVTAYIRNDAAEEDIKAMIADHKSLPVKLASAIKDSVSDFLLYHFSASESRIPAKAAKYKTVLNDYGMDFIDFSPGKSVTSKECRFVKALESEHPRGTCVETLASGIINLSSGYVIYKADVVISK